MGSVNGHKGKRYKPRLYAITFPEDSDFADLEAKVRGASVDAVLNLMEVADLAGDVADGSAGTVTERHRKAVATMIAEFTPLIHWWNVDDEHGEPVPTTEAGVRSQDFAMVFALYQAWSYRTALVPPPLPGASSGGPDTGLEALMPMETVSASPPS